MLDDTHMYCQSQTTTMQETNTMTLTNTMCSDMRHMDVHTYIFIFATEVLMWFGSKPGRFVSKQLLSS